MEARQEALAAEETPEDEGEATDCVTALAEKFNLSHGEAEAIVKFLEEYEGGTPASE